MVGVPGRSKGCNTCRKRKIRCDAQKPFCQRCISTGRQCEGYEKYPTFMIWTQDGYQPRSRLDDMKPASSSPNSNSSSDDSKSALVLHPSHEAVVKAPLATNIWSDQVTSKFIELQYSSSDFYKSDPGVVWIHESITINHGCEPLTLALKALASVRVGWSHKNEDLTRHGSLLYGQALQSLQRALYDPRLASEEYTFVAARAMVMYEHYMSTSASPTAWASHVNGLMLILMNRGPRPFETICGRAAMEDVRDTMMIKAYMERKRIFLLEPQWMTLPWAGLVKDSRQQVCDGGLQLAALLHDYDNAISDSAEPTVDTLGEILHRGLNYLTMVQSLDLENSSMGIPSEVITFSSAQSVAASLHCWALTIGFRQLFDPLTKRLLNSDVAELPTQITHDIQAVLDQLSESVCLDICHRIMSAAEVLMSTEMEYAGSRRLPFPMLSTIYFLTSIDAPQLAEAKDLYRRFKTDKGVGITSQIGKSISKRFDTCNVKGSTGIAHG